MEPCSIFTIPEAAAQPRFSTNTVRKLLQEGRIKRARTGQYGGKWRISQKALDDFVVGVDQ